jgi:hypothetical protein
VSTSRLAGDLMAKFTFELQEVVKYTTEIEAENVFEAYDALRKDAEEGVVGENFDLIEKDNTGFDIIPNPYEPLTI